MTKSSNTHTGQFATTVVPIMDKVRDTLNSRRADELRRHVNSPRSAMAVAAGPDGGMTALSLYNDQVNYMGQWSSKTVEDYVDMVKAELRKRNITVDAAMEKRMIDHLVKQDMSKSATEYVMRKAAEGSLFHIPQRVRETSLQDHIHKEGEKRYNPSLLEEATGNILAWLSNAATTMGFGGLLGQVAIDGAVEGTDSLAQGQQQKYLDIERKKGKKEVAAVGKKKASIPLWMCSQMGFASIGKASDRQLSIALKWAIDNGNTYRSKVSRALQAGERTVKASGKSGVLSVGDATYRAMEYEAFAKAIAKEQSNRKTLGKDAVSYGKIEEAEEQHFSNTTDSTHTTSTNQDSQADTQARTNNNTGDYSGWNNLLDSMGLSGIGDTMRHMGVTLSMLPDLLLGVFTGKTKSVGLNQQTLMPLAAIVSGTFIKNPLLKFPLMLWGGANLLNKFGQEGLSEYRKGQGTASVRYKQYDDEPLNDRMRNPQIEGNVLFVDIDNVPRVITLPGSVIAAYKAGALPLNTLANHVLSKADNMQTMQVQQETHDLSNQYERKQECEQTRGIR